MIIFHAVYEAWEDIQREVSAYLPGSLISHNTVCFQLSVVFKEYSDYISMIQQLCMLWSMEQLKYKVMCQAKPNKHLSKPHHHGF